jgi:DNA gyrase subunit A
MIAREILPMRIEDEMRLSYTRYAMSVIVGRALPDARDGLKPVHRRILYAMFDQGMLPDRRREKCASAVGEVLKNITRTATLAFMMPSYAWRRISRCAIR